jgi:heat shock protein HslJ
MTGTTMPLFARALPVLATLALGLSVVACAQGGGGATPPPGTVDVALGRGLQDKVWTLQSGTEAGGQPIAGLMVPGHAFVLRFDAARLGVTGGCNNLSGPWQLDGQGRLTVGRMASTMKGCEPALMQADRALASLLAQPLDVKLEPGAAPRLSLASPTRQTLLLAGEPTLESRYGAPTRLFLEVAPQTVPCQPGAGAPTQCLQVRERRFDDKGLRIDPPGEWRAFHGSIEGYTHTPGVRNVLRLKRYSRGTVPADASAYLYVLDLVVESATEKP